MKKKALIIGFGSIGKKHFNVIKKILSIDNIYILSRRKLRFKNSFTDKSMLNERAMLYCFKYMPVVEMAIANERATLFMSYRAGM